METWKSQGQNAEGQDQSNGNGKSPQPPFPPLNLPQAWNGKLEATHGLSFVGH
jgi:hypothetical protein